MIKLKNISYLIQEKQILDDISLDINHGDFITIIGPNGAGKTTLVKIILGALSPSKGTLVKDNNLKVGYVPQRLTVNNFIPITVKEFLLLHLQPPQNLLDEILNKLQIEYLLSHQLSALSGGESQKILLAKALLSSPDILILDEPTQSLDIGGQNEIYGLIENIHKEQKLTTLMISHNLHIVLASSNMVICLYKHICCSGKAETITKNPQFASIFGEETTKLLSVYNHSHNE